MYVAFNGYELNWDGYKNSFENKSNVGVKIKTFKIS